MARKKAHKKTPYLENIILFHPPAVETAKSFREGIRWIFDLLRNIVIVGLILYLGIKTESTALKAIALGANLLLYVYVFSYFDTWIFQPFHFLKNKTLAMLLDISVSFSLIMALTLGSYHLLTFAIDEIAKAHFR